MPHLFDLISYKVFKIKSVARKLLILILMMLSCKSTQETQVLEVVTTIEEQDTNAKSESGIEFSVGPNVEVQDVELSDFNNFEVWVTTKYMDTIGNCKLERVNRIKGIDTLSHFFVKFKTLPIVYKMKVENKNLTFANINK